MIQDRAIDHLVYTVKDLEATCDKFEKQLGARPVFGGYRRTQGTKNALIKLSNTCYLEVLAIDHNNTHVKQPRWMGVDVLTTDQLTRWAVKSNDLSTDQKTLKEFNPDMGNIRPGSRTTPSGLLEWELIQPLPEPEVEIIPFMLNWDTSTNHPCDTLPDCGCKLINFQITHPSPEAIKPLFKNLGVSIEITPNTKTTLSADIECPNGMVRL